MSYECAYLFTHVLLIADMLYARGGSSVYIIVARMDPDASHGRGLDVRNLRGIYTSRPSRTQNIEERLLWKVHAADPLQFTFRFLLVF